MVPLHNIDYDVVKVQKLYDITKPWLEKVGALRKKRGCAYFDTPSSFVYVSRLPHDNFPAIGNIDTLRERCHAEIRRSHVRDAHAAHQVINGC